MSELWTAALVGQLSTSFESNADQARARQMARYMKDQFPFFGIGATVRRSLQRSALRETPKPSERELARVAHACWTRSEREFQYFAADYVRAHVRDCAAGFIDVLEHLIRMKSWWDTVDVLASRGVGPLALRHPSVRESMDVWIESEDIWVARTALLYQLSFKQETDADRLFAYCRVRMSDDEFFVRKAIGWALREYSKTDPKAVRRFVRDNADSLSGLTRREALRWIERGDSSCV